MWPAEQNPALGWARGVAEGLVASGVHQGQIKVIGMGQRLFEYIGAAEDKDLVFIPGHFKRLFKRMRLFTPGGQRQAVPAAEDDIPAVGDQGFGRFQAGPAHNKGFTLGHAPEISPIVGQAPGQPVVDADHPVFAHCGNKGYLMHRLWFQDFCLFTLSDNAKV